MKIGILIFSFGVLFVCLYLMIKNNKKADEVFRQLEKKCDEIEEYYQIIHEDAQKYDRDLDDVIRYHILQKDSLDLERGHQTISYEERMKEDMEENMLPFKNRVYRMHEEGFSVKQIAKKLNCGEKEIEYIIKFKP